MELALIRTHTHGLGVRVSAWREREGTWTLLGSGDPRKPQMFYLMKGDPNVIRKGSELIFMLYLQCYTESDTIFTLNNIHAEQSISLLRHMKKAEHVLQILNF